MRYTSFLIAILACLFLAGTLSSQQSSLYVAIDSTNLMLKTGQKIGLLNKGTKLTILETEEKWVKVSVEGWIDKRYTSTIATEVSKGPLELLDFDVTARPKDILNSRFSDTVVLTLHIKNNTSQRIKAWRLNLRVTNSFGDELVPSIQLTSGSANLKPGKIQKANFSWEDNEFLGDEVYDKLSGYSKETLQLHFLDVKLVQ